MTDRDLPEFVVLMAMLDKAFDKETSKLKAEVYFQGLRDFDLEDLKKAVVRAIQTLTFYPKVAELREIVEGAPDDRALAAWELVMAMVECVGTYKSVFFDDPAIHYAVDALGGWPAIGQWPEKEIPFKQQDFTRLYRLGLKREVTWADVPHYLPGIHEADNTFHGHLDAIKGPVKVACRYLTSHARQEVEATRPKAVGPGTEETAGKGKEE